MRFERLSISNLRAIKHFEVEELGNFVVVAGQNGSGKSCVFDAIRLLKSVYGGYSANEYHQWFGEFAVDLGDRNALAKLFRAPSKPIVIRGTILFDSTEIQYMKDNAENLVQPLAWQQVTGQPVDFWTFSRVGIAAQLRQHQPELTQAASDLARNIRQELSTTTMHTIALEIRPNGDMAIEPCQAVEVAFQAYEPEHLGVIEYHSASRTYSRQQVGGINLDTRAFEDQRRTQRLYNAQTKYQNIKTELATSYLRNIIARESGETEAADDLNETLKELFATFFPDKSYEGVRPRPGGALDFPVRLTTGEVHDIDELSSGEKEILYGYLKLKNSTPRTSVILVDEPELHLNPSLLQGFADFYYRHLGVAQGNQLWLVTHSDTLLRQAVGNANYRVFQMVAASAMDGTENQAVEVIADDDVERVTIDLVGELASYRPHGKVVILEGQTENGFDVNVVSRLFPDFSRRVNLVSGGNKRRVRDLYDALQDVAAQTGMRNRFFVIVDKDREASTPIASGAAEFAWDVYHIENYLLDVGCVRAATTTLLGGNDPFESDDQVLEELRVCASELVHALVLESLQQEINGELVHAINIGGPPETENPATDLYPSIEGSLGRLQDVGATLTITELTTRADTHRVNLETALADGSWIREFPGRLVLRRYAHKRLLGRIDSLLFSNTVLDKMVERGVQPDSMARILDMIATR
jgi:predicted ATPase